MTQWLKIGALLASAFPLAAAQQDEGQRLVDGFVTGVVTLESRFEQALLDPAGEVIERNSGTLEIQRPGRFRWDYSEPYEQQLVADGLNIWNYDVDLEQVTVKPQAEALANTPALLLGGSGDALAQFDYEGSYVEKDTRWVRLVPKNTESGFTRVELGFLGETLYRMVFFDTLKQTTLVSLLDVRVNQPIHAERFRFVVPDGVDVVGTPAEAATPDP